MNIKIKKIINENLAKKTFSSVSVGYICNKGGKRKKSIIYMGRHCINSNILTNEKTFFDLASLTKPFVSVFCILSLIKNKNLQISFKIKDIFKDIIIDDIKSNITIKNIISHSAGFPSHIDYYKKLIEVKPEKRKELLLKTLMNESLIYKPGSQVIYSDLGYMLLGLIIEKISGQSLDTYFRENIVEPTGFAGHLFFNPIGKPKHHFERFAAVEDCPWRGKVLQGEVSDENCWALGGVAGHAGLYGDMYGVLGFASLILDIWLGKKKHPNINRQDLDCFLQKNDQLKGNTWALGFDTPTPDKSSSGKYLSPRSVGHLGFTGTSFWLDPERELVIVILSNRVHPSRDNNLIKEFRPAVHDLVVESLDRRLS